MLADAATAAENAIATVNGSTFQTAADQARLVIIQAAVASDQATDAANTQAVLVALQAPVGAAQAAMSSLTPTTAPPAQ
jgi:hypothetical protein